ncbi:MAG TPA: hypothetical protein VMK84_30385 [Streptosporangiaceae bacterium]|nr:hypothetical protein [Streptosporangiaceae bacterium]
MRLSRQLALVAAAPLAATVLLAGCGGGAPRRSTPAATASVAGTGSPSATSASPVASATPRATASASPAALPVAPGAGALPQTRAFPRTDSAAFRNAMADLWLAVTTGNPRFGLPGFFPVAAYQQVKAEPYPVADWQDRLWYDFVLDVRAAHRLLGSGATLDRVIVPGAYAAWVYPGACYNKIGYWHLPGARVVYREHGQQRSFGIASLISWRGVWYVVHLGAVQRTVATGIVDQPAAGSGVPGPPGGC